MLPTDDWWALQFVERLKELAQAYDRFCVTREIEDFDIAYALYEKLNSAYGISMDLLDLVEFGRALLAKQTLPNI